MSALKESQHLNIPLKEIKEATEDFKTEIGRGGFGEVYRGELSISGKPTTVAVKKLNENFGQGLKEFLTEIQLLSGLNHPNLISLLGYCEEGNEKIIIYEYAERGSLDTYLSRNPTYCLTWLERLRICVDAARGLEHLHNHVGRHQTIIHRDIKSANILIDHNWVAKISDLGLSKLSFAGLNRSAVISHPCGTLFYCEPEYRKTRIVKKESDVYSFGMVLFEVLCGRLFFGPLAKDYYEKEKLDEIIDPRIREQMSSESMNKFSAIAYGCMQDDRGDRPPMDVVVKELEESLEIQASGSWSSYTASSSGGTNNNVINEVEIDNDSLDYEILRDDLEIEERIGRGSCGNVYFALWNGLDVAVKIFYKQEYPDDVILSFKKEVSLMQRLQHPNILLLLGAVTSPPHLCIVTEFHPNGSLFELLQRNAIKLDWRRRIRMAMDVARGMNYLHHCHPPIVHRDLKSSNLLFDEDWTVKVGDYGFSRIKHEMMATRTPQWVAPEILRGEQADKKSDVYSYGVVLWEFATREIPWVGLKSMQVKEAVLLNQRLEIPEDVDPQWASLIESCWSSERQSRPTFQEILTKLEDLQQKFARQFRGPIKR